MHDAILQFIGLTCPSVNQLTMLAVRTFSKITSNIIQFGLDKAK